MKPLSVVELAVPDDAEAICRIRDEAWIDTYPSEELGLTAEDVKINAQGLNGEFVPRRIRWFKEKIASSDEDWVAYVVKIEHVVRGFVVASKGNDGVRQINSIYVQPGFQGKGLGGKLMQTALEYLGNNADIHLEVARHNQNAIDFYEHFGFQKTNNTVEEEPDRPSYMKSIPQLEMIKYK